MSKKRVCSIQFGVIWHEKLAGCGCFIPNISRFFTHMTHAEEVEIKYQCIHLLYSFFQNCSHRVLPDFTQFTGEIELDYLDVIAIVETRKTVSFCIYSKRLTQLIFAFLHTMSVTHIAVY